MESASIEDFLSTLEVMAATGKARKTIQRWVKSGYLTPVKKLPGKTGAHLFARSDVERVIQEDAA